ncbi:hypothetical protein SEEH8440_04102, partial [Salmonella enterica subsp. enterica serovar Heidelberg str. N18440]
ATVKELKKDGFNFMNKTALIMILGILGCGKAFAATELQLQQKTRYAFLCQCQPSVVDCRYNLCEYV